MALSRLPLKRKIVDRFLCPRLYSSQTMRWRDVLGFVPAGNVSSSSTFQILRDANPPVMVALPASLTALGRLLRSSLLDPSPRLAPPPPPSSRQCLFLKINAISPSARQFIPENYHDIPFIKTVFIPEN